MSQLWKSCAILVLLVIILTPRPLTNALGGFTNHIEEITSSTEPIENKLVGPLKQTSISTSSLSVSLRQIFNDVEELIRSVIQNVSSFVPQLTTDMKDLVNTLAKRMTNALEEFSLKLLDSGELLLRDIVRNMLQQLQQMKDEFQSLAQMADQQFGSVVDYFNNTLMNQSENIDAWAAQLKQDMRTVNDTRLYKEGCLVVDDFIKHSTDELRHCCNIAVRPVRSLCQNVRTLLAEAFRVLADAMERMQTCLEDKNSYLEYMVPCINVAYDDVNAFISRAAQLRHDLTTMLPVKLMFSRFCISVVSVQMEQRQSQVERTIDETLRVRNKI